jgi:hypothetical protein
MQNVVEITNSKKSGHFDKFINPVPMEMEMRGFPDVGVVVLLKYSKCDVPLMIIFVKDNFVPST